MSRSIRAWALALVLTLSLLPGAAFCAESFELDRVVAVVDKTVITWAELYRSMEFEFSQRLSSLDGEQKREFLGEMQHEYLDRMIEMTLQKQEAAKLNLRVEPGEIDEALGSIKQKYGFSDEQFQRALAEEGFGYQEYRERLSEQILMGKVASAQVRNNLVVTDKEVEKYIAEKGLKGAGESYRLQQVFIARPKAGGEPQAEARAREALLRVRAGEDFKAVAREYSDADPELGLVKKDMLAGDFLNVIEALKPGEVSEPFWTEQGLHLVKLQEKISPDEKAALMQKARKELQERAFEREYRNWIRGLRERAFVEIRLR